MTLDVPVTGQALPHDRIRQPTPWTVIHPLLGFHGDMGIDAVFHDAELDELGLTASAAGSK